MLLDINKVSYKMNCILKGALLYTAVQMVLLQFCVCVKELSPCSKWGQFMKLWYAIIRVGGAESLSLMELPPYIAQKEQPSFLIKSGTLSDTHYWVI